jgi:uncharacterized protein YfaS (alpha-2-macroglobulin family)
MKTITVLILLSALCFGFIPLFGQAPDYSKLKSMAEATFAEGSYARAHELYAQASSLKLTADEQRWVSFRLADTQWRAEAATQTADVTRFEEAQHRLELLIRDIQRPEDQDLVWAEIQESLGDSSWMRPNYNNWSAAWPPYQAALDWWAGSADLDRARERYLKITWKMAQPAGVARYYSYGDFGNRIPLNILENALKISTTNGDKAHAHYLIAETLRWQSLEIDQRHRVAEEFEAALKIGKSTDWYDDALFHYAQWIQSYGRMTLTEDGEEHFEPDYVKALQLYRQLIQEFHQGETRYFDQAKQQINEITRPVAAITVSNFFLPGSEIEFRLNWRNVKSVEFELYRVNLTRDVAAHDPNRLASSWLQNVSPSGSDAVKKWSRETHDQGEYKPGAETVRLDTKLPVGAYLLKASAGGIDSRDLILVTDASLVLKTSGTQALVYFCNALDGSPIPGSNILLWETTYNYRTQSWTGHQTVKPTNAQGLAVFDLSRSANQLQLFAAGALQDRQAFALGSNNNYGQSADNWRIYAFTDRPAYRSKEDVHWKFIARKYHGDSYSTPANQPLEYEIIDPRGTRVQNSKAQLNAFGSAWGTLETTGAMPLGEYRITFYEPGSKNAIGSATLFRLEEYKLPEFKVSVETPQENGKKKVFRLGDTVEVNVQADYYFGGPVNDAAVEVVVYQNSFYPRWYPPHDFPWYYEHASSQPYYSRGTQGQVIKREILKTDSNGKVSLTFDTPRNASQDYEYKIEARVTDASRREILGSGRVRVTRQLYYVYANPQHFLYRPKDKVGMDFKALDANDQPLQVEGTVKLSRDYWYEIWVDPSGREVKGEELSVLKRRPAIFPPPPDADGRAWRLKFRGYQHDEIGSAQTLKTDGEGHTTFSFVAENVGYYRITWSSKPKEGPLIKTEASVWVTDNATTALGYHHDGVEIIVDKDTFHVGQTSPVMLAVPANDRYVLFSIEGDNLYDYQLVHVTGNVKLMEIAVEERHVPNIFLSATMVSDRQISIDTKQVIVPPIRNFLTVDVKSDRDQYLPREQGTLTISTRDHDGKPVAAEVALGLVDESVYYIQEDYAGDPRQFYYGTKRLNRIQNQSTFNQKSYAKLVEGLDNRLIDERELGLALGPGRGSAFGSGVEGGVPGGQVGGVLGGIISVNGARAESVITEGQLQSPGMPRMKMAVMNSAMPATPPAPGEGPAVQVRTDFRSTVFWQPDVSTNQDGEATVKVTYPDSLTTWKATARVESAINQFGIASTTMRTQQPLIVRLQAPRFFLVGDTVTVSAVMNNNTAKPMVVTPTIDAIGLVITDAAESKTVTVPPNGEIRTDWKVLVREPGEARVKVTARGEPYSDAMEKTFSVYEHGIEKFIAKSGKVRGSEVLVKLEIPKERKKESTLLAVQIAPSMAVTMLDALPYLLNYPYGCTEQTMSRFLPAAITAKTLKDLGVQPDTVMNKVFGGIEPASAQVTHPAGRKDLHQLDEIIQLGLDRLYDFQHGDGGWGWWKDGSTDPFMTSYVVWGLSMARDAGIKLKPEVLDRGADYLDKKLVEAENQYDLQAWMLHGLSSYYASTRKPAPGSFMSKAFDNLWANRSRLNAYTRSLLALSAHNLGYDEQARVLIRNLENGVKVDKTPDVSILERGTSISDSSVLATAHWGEDRLYWQWSDGGVEATASALRALLAIDPQNKLIEPVTNWLIKNRRGAQWNNTRDTAMVVLALNDYLRISGEIRPDVGYELQVNGHSIVTKKLAGGDIFSAPSIYRIDPHIIKDGLNEIRIIRTNGHSPLYFSAQAKYFSLEEPIPSAGNEIFVRRQYYELVGHPTLLKGYVYDKQLLNDGESITSGDRVQVVITIEAKNNYEYLVFEDLKPAGLEAVQLRSGEPASARELKAKSLESKTEVQSSGAQVQSSKIKVQGPESMTAGVSDQDYTGRSQWVYQELRDRKVALFIDKLPQGFWEIRYDLRAEVPGKFHALPVVGYAMYVPEIRANGDEIRITVVDKK